MARSAEIKPNLTSNKEIVAALNTNSSNLNIDVIHRCNGYKCNDEAIAHVPSKIFCR